MPLHTIDRREFLAVSGAAALTVATQACSQEAAPAPVLRTISYNVLACAGYDGKARDSAAIVRMAPQIPARLALELALYEPDVVTLQESPEQAVVADVAQRMGMHHAYFPGGFPGSVLSRFPIVAQENCPLAEGERPEDLFTRHWGKAVLRMTAGDLAVYSAHLFPGRDGQERRLREISLILEAMGPELASGRPLILQGDLNHGPDTPEYERWVGAGLEDCFAAKGTGQPATHPSTTPRQRIDYVWTHGAFPAPLRECRVLFEGAFRTNPEDPGSVALSDHVPVLAVFGR